jgi:hypothetical protein
MTFSDVFERIVTINHTWKVSRDELGYKHPVTLALRDQKSSWQATLIREFKGATYLHFDDENTDGEPLYSLRLKSPFTMSNGTIRLDAEHIPIRIATDLFTNEEIQRLLEDV